MNTITTRSILGGALTCAVALLPLALSSPYTQDASAQAPAAPPPALEEKIAAIKEAFQASQAKLKGFQWIQTTTVSVNGEQKKQKVDQVYYGAEGTLVKVPLSETPAEGDDHERGLRGRIVVGFPRADVHGILVRPRTPNPLSEP